MSRDFEEIENMWQYACCQEKPLFQCYYCGSHSVHWGADFLSEEYGYDEGGIVRTLHCSNCGAEIEYYLPGDEDEEEKT